MRDGLLERVIERTAGSMADAQVMVDVNHPLRCEIILTAKDGLADGGPASGGDAEAPVRAAAS